MIENIGHCVICDQLTVFRSNHAWLRDYYFCERCGTCPRQRAVVEVLNVVRPAWRTLEIHESSPCIGYFSQQAPRYTHSHLLDGVPLGEAGPSGDKCEDLERLTFADDSLDIFLTQDVLEHVFRPDQALREIMRVLKPGGVHVFTTPKYHSLAGTRQRARTGADGIEHILPAEYHGNPVGDGRSLVTWDYGLDFETVAAEWSGYLISTIVIRDRSRGIDGEFLEVFVSLKDERNYRTTSAAAGGDSSG